MSKKTGGWASADKKSATSEKNSLNLLEQERFFLDTDILDIPTIPDIDDLVPEQLSEELQPSKPSATIKSATYKELDTETNSPLEGIDLGILTRCLQEDVKEEDIPWTWNSLFVEFTSTKVLETLSPEKVIE